jgi:hypothetical protein
MYGEADGLPPAYGMSDEDAFVRVCALYDAVEKKDWKAADVAADKYLDVAYRPDSKLLLYCFGRLIPVCKNAEGDGIFPSTGEGMFGFVEADPSSRMEDRNYEDIKYWIRNGLFRDDGDQDYYLVFTQITYEKRMKDIKDDCIQALAQLPEKSSDDSAKKIKEEEAEKLIALFVDILKFQISLTEDFLRLLGEECPLSAADAICGLADDMVEGKLRNISSMLSALAVVWKICGDENVGDYNPDCIDDRIEMMKEAMKSMGGSEGGGGGGGERKKAAA